MSFIWVLLVLLVMGSVLVTSIALAAHGFPWLLLASVVVFLGLFVKFGCLPAKE